MALSCLSSVLAIIKGPTAGEAEEVATRDALLRRRLLVGETAAATEREAAANLEEEVAALECAVAAADAAADELVLAAAAKGRRIRELELEIQAVNNMTSRWRWA
uniref:GTD-binding domain-containing protein n=1 Tax=Leersia perrieri TaxID=77586 RepID=A0A0D9WDW5_9ORYZ